MNLWHSLLNTYEKYEKENLVGKRLDNSTVRVLPIFHNDRTVSKTDKVVEITLDDQGEFLTASLLEEESYIIFPVTLDSVSRSGIKAPPHPLADDLQYVSKYFDEKKHGEYVHQLEEWVKFSRFTEIKIIFNYILENRIVDDILSNLDKSVVDKKTFITFSIKKETGFWNLTDSSELHKNYISYVEHLLSTEKQGYCGVTGKKMYLSNKHRGLLGTAKLISISNNEETYSGRISKKDKVSFLGYKTSEKIFLMLRYLLNQKQFSHSLGDNTYLIVWDNDIEGNNINITGQQVEDDFTTTWNESEFEEFDLTLPIIDSKSNVLNPIISAERIKHLTGYKEVNPDQEYYVLILHKISNGRLSIKYYRNFSGSDLSQRITDWYITTNWPIWTREGYKNITLRLYDYVHRIVGLETKDKKIISRNNKINRWYIEKLLMCILEGKPLPMDLYNKLRSNITHRERYQKTWHHLEIASLSFIKKFYSDYFNQSQEKEVIPLLRQNNDRSYLFGRMMAVAENIEQVAMGDYTRSTQVSKYWHQLCMRPQSGFNRVKSRLLSYETKLQNSKPGAYINRDRLMQEIYDKLNMNEEYLANPNKPLSDLFMVGYYAQKKDLSNTKTKEEVESI